MMISDLDISFFHDELMGICEAYVVNTTHRTELAKIFTRYFPAREEPYLLNDIRSIYKQGGLYDCFIFKRNGLDLMSSDEFKDILSNVHSEGRISVFEKMRAEWKPVDPVFFQSLEENLFEFDVIPEVMNGLSIFLADLILRSLVQCDITFTFSKRLEELDLEIYKDIKFFFNTYAGGLGNKKRIMSAIKNYKQITTFNIQEKNKIARLYLIGGSDFLLVKHHTISFYLNYYDEFKSFNEWHEKVEYVIMTCMSILLPKMQPLLNKIDEKVLKGEYKELFKYVQRTFYDIYMSLELSKRALAFGANAEPEDIGDGYDFCVPEHCEAFHKHKKQFQKRPGVHFVIAECNQLRSQRLGYLREYFALGSFKKQSAFAKSLKENLHILTGKSDLLFEEQEAFKQLCDIYHRGLLRYFWKHENLKQMKLDYEELCRYIQEEGADRLFHKDGDVVRIKFNALDEEGWWVDQMLDFKYQPAHSKDNYNKLIETLFGNRKCVRVGSKDIGVHVVLFLIMFYYWIYLSIEGESAEDIRLWSRCTFHKKLPEK